MKIQSFSITGNERTKESVIESEFYKAYTTNDPQEIFHNLSVAVSALKASGNFESVDTSVEIIDDGPDSALESGSDLMNPIATTSSNTPVREQELKVFVKVKEKGIPYLSVTTDVKTAHGVVGDVGGDMKFGLRSPFGYGESVSLQHVKGLAGAADWSLGLNVPNLKGIYGYCTGESLAAAEIAAAASAAGVGASSAAIPASLPPASTASSMATAKTTALAPSILESCAASLKPLRNHALHSFALGSLSFNVSSTIENSFNRNSLLYKNLGVVSTWRSATGRNTVSFECMKREEEPPAPYGDGSIGLMSGLGASTFAGMNVGPEAGKPPLMTTTGDVASQVQHGLDLLQYSVGRRRNVPYEILCQARPSVRTGVKLSTVLHDSRDNRVSPSTGELVDLTVESYGWPGSTVTPYVKTDVALQKHWNISKIFAAWKTGDFSYSLGHLNNIGGQGAVPAKPATKSWFGVPADVVGCVASVAVNAGVILPLGRGSRGTRATTSDGTSIGSVIPLADRYTLGGPFSLRGFDLHSVGNQAPACAPRTDSSAKIMPGKATGKAPGIADLIGYDPKEAGRALGGSTRASLLATVSVPIPVVDIAQAGGRAFLFANVGCLGNGFTGGFTTTGGGVTIGHCWSTPRISVGGGFAFNFASQARIEATYAIPVYCNANDNTNKFQFGIGLTIM